MEQVTVEFVQGPVLSAPTEGEPHQAGPWYFGHRS